MIRRIVEIDEERCTGCEACADACHEGAIAMVNGKAKLIKDDYCDGLGDCLPACPVDAISIIEREAVEYDEEAVKQRMAEKAMQKAGNHGAGHVCPGSMARSLKRVESKKEQEVYTVNMESRLKQWPVQIKLVPIKAPYYENANLLIAADCTAYAYARFHEDFMKNHITIIGCPKLDAVDYSEKLCEILRQNEIKSVKIARMEVPCCGGLANAVIEAMRRSQKMIPWQVVTVRCDGTIQE